LPLNLALFSAHRFGMDLRSNDFQTGAVALPTFVADARSQTAVEVKAHPTHDGYYVATVPVGAGRFAVGVQLGALCEWVQIDEAGFYPVDDYIRHGEQARPAMIRAQLVCDGMEEQAPGLYRCAQGALMLAPPPKVSSDEPHLLAIVFRPLVWRHAIELRKAA
jgi:hypothetical protein